MAINGVDALNMIKERRNLEYKLILMDMQKPVTDGLEATRILLREHENKCPPIIAMTANAFEEDKKKCFEAGMVGFLSKPIRVKEVQSILNAKLKKTA